MYDSGQLGGSRSCKRAGLCRGRLRSNIEVVPTAESRQRSGGRLPAPATDDCAVIVRGLQ